MKVTLIDYTGKGILTPAAVPAEEAHISAEARHAANVLVFTKSTRLEMKPELMDEIANRPWSEIEKELDYMSRTIPSSWEFVDYTFLITDVTRAFTHQFVRTRTGSYAQQTMRVLNVSGWDYATGPGLRCFEQNYLSQDLSCVSRVENPRDWYDREMNMIQMTYQEMIKAGVPVEDARGILPTNILTNIAAKFSLRTLCDLVRKRSSSRTQGEYRDVLDGMKSEVVRVHPWAVKFLERDFDRAAEELEDHVIGLAERSLGAVTRDEVTTMIKLIDQMRQS